MMIYIRSTEHREVGSILFDPDPIDTTNLHRHPYSDWPLKPVVFLLCNPFLRHPAGFVLVGQELNCWQSMEYRGRWERNNFARLRSTNNRQLFSRRTRSFFLRPWPNDLFSICASFCQELLCTLPYTVRVCWIPAGTNSFSDSGLRLG
ncbi:hypothetical protein CPSG_07695 [Coccidioides posadasii str. Silveira]|uniref:Uncharacterized protein n=1 Tax=Coccidioides posadasii (strain RMSCC 757 / Silveira) TaxID=443226 RepID=E9DDQ3_COCPS|nr:hypothetical protein CPSG_07695 [Coccidioides posadasii str. Silveira]